MRKMTMFFVLITTLMLCSSFAENNLNISDKNDAPVSDELAEAAERSMLNGIEFIEEDEEVSLGFDTDLYLPFYFNAYKGMDLDLNDIEYVELDEEDL